MNKVIHVCVSVPPGHWIDYFSVVGYRWETKSSGKQRVVRVLKGKSTSSSDIVGSVHKMCATVERKYANV